MAKDTENNFLVLHGKITGYFILFFISYFNIFLKIQLFLNNRMKHSSQNLATRSLVFMQEQIHWSTLKRQRHTAIHRESEKSQSTVIL